MSKRKLISQTLLLGSILTMVGLYYLTRNHEGQETILAGVSLALIGASLLAERLSPFDRLWNPDLAGAKGDIAMAGLIFGVLDGLLKWMTPFAIIFIASFYQPATALPLYVEVPVAILAIEFMAWFSHWLHHRFKPLWALHAMHHSPNKLYTLNNFRFHPLNHITNHLFMLVPVLALGLSAQAVLFYTVLSLPVLVFQHSNINFEFGWVDKFFNTNVVHRYHHSTDLREGVSNLGRATLIWDHVFGTYFGPGRNRQPQGIGLFRQSLNNYPAKGSIWKQMAWPFGKDCCAN